jgi:carbonic anhydrase
VDRLQEILDYNHLFVERKGYEKYQATKYPAKRIAIVTCMDARLLELLPKAMNLKNGDAVIIKVAGGEFSEHLDSVIRSLLISIYELHVEDIFIIGHHNCGAQHLCPDAIMNEIALECGELEGMGKQIKELLNGFGNLEASVKKSVSLLKKQPFIPKRISVHGLLIDPDTGKLEVVDRSNLELTREKEAVLV